MSSRRQSHYETESRLEDNYDKYVSRDTVVSRDKYKKAKEAARTWYSKYESMKEDNELLQNKIQELNQTIEKLFIENKTDNKSSSEYNKLSNEYDKLSNEYDKLSNEYKELCNKHNKLSNELKDLTKSYENLTNEHSKVCKEYDKLTNENNKLCKEYDKLLTQHNNLTNDYNKLDKNNSVEELKKKFKEKEESYKDKITLLERDKILAEGRVQHLEESRKDLYERMSELKQENRELYKELRKGST